MKSRSFDGSAGTVATLPLQDKKRGTYAVPDVKEDKTTDTNSPLNRLHARDSLFNGETGETGSLVN